jgi:formamidopyrimidine-DNA glycosylase
MPELPEVETVVRDLRPLLTGRTVTGVRRGKSRLRRPWAATADALVVGAAVTGLRRRGKWILVDFAGGQALRVHLGMTGQFTVVPAADPDPDHLHFAFRLDDAGELRFRDPRRFGSVEFCPSAAAAAAALDAVMGPEPFGLDPVAFRAAVTGTGRSLKAVLLDQTVVAGVGNIYADEACFRARLHPGRTGKSLSAEECDRLRTAIEAVLTRAIDGRGSTIRDYVGGSGRGGAFQHEHAVYGRTGEPCPGCAAGVECVRLAGRSSHYCPRCQDRSTTTHTKGTKRKQGKKSV